MGNTTTNDSTTRATMQVGTLLRAKRNGKMFMITEEITILRQNRSTKNKIKGYKVSPCDRLDWGIAVAHDDIPDRFEVVS